MAALPPPPPGYPRSRDALRLVAVHVMARGRSAATGRIGLRALPGGFGTPAFGDGPEVVRLDGDVLIHETGSGTRVAQLTTLADAAELVGVDLAAPLSVGHDTPPQGDPHADLRVDPAAADLVATWFGLVATALDGVIAGLPPAAAPSVAQLWPEHFDLAIDVAWGDGEGQRVNLGGSAGDDGEPEPYAYVGPWTADRPGDPAFWNAPFGSVLPHRAVAAAGSPADARGTLAAFFRQGIDLLAAGASS